MNELKKMWENFEIEVENFEDLQMEKLLSKLGKTEKELKRNEWISLNDKLKNAVERKFNKKSRELVSMHLSVSNS